jgi:hypothetical protein
MSDLIPYIIKGLIIGSLTLLIKIIYAQLKKKRNSKD